MPATMNSLVVIAKMPSPSTYTTAGMNGPPFLIDVYKIMATAIRAHFDRSAQRGQCPLHDVEQRPPVRGDAAQYPQSVVGALQRPGQPSRIAVGGELAGPLPVGTSRRASSSRAKCRR